MASEEFERRFETGQITESLDFIEWLVRSKPFCCSKPTGKPSREPPFVENAKKPQEWLKQAVLRFCFYAEWIEHSHPLPR